MSRTTSVRCDRCLRPVGRDASVFSARCENLTTILHNVPADRSFDLCLACSTRFVEFIMEGRAEASQAAIPGPDAVHYLECLRTGEHAATIGPESVERRGSAQVPINDLRKPLAVADMRPISGR